MVVYRLRDYLVIGGSGDSQAQAATLDGRNDFTGGVAAEDQSTGGHVLLHGPAQGVLCILCQLVHLSQYHHYTEEEEWGEEREREARLTSHGHIKLCIQNA